MEQEEVVGLIKAINRRLPTFFREYPYAQMRIGKDWAKDYPLAEQGEYLRFVLSAIDSGNTNAVDAVGMIRICGGTVAVMPNGTKEIIFYVPETETPQERKEHRRELLDVIEVVEEFWPELHDALNK